jgi:hypothetical protein
MSLLEFRHGACALSYLARDLVLRAHLQHQPGTRQGASKAVDSPYTCFVKYCIGAGRLKRLVRWSPEFRSAAEGSITHLVKQAVS